MTIATQIKDPDATLDYGLDWGPWLKQSDGSVDVITDSEWHVHGPDEALTTTAAYRDSAIAGVWVSGGTAGQEYRLTNRITTAGGRIDDRSILFRIAER